MNRLVAIVSAGGDIVDPATGRSVAGALGPDGHTFIDARVALRSGSGYPAVRDLRRQ